MATVLDIPLGHLHNLASHFHEDAEVRDLIKKGYTKHHTSILHYTRIGSKYCPRVLLECEYIIKTIYARDQYELFKGYIEREHPNAYNK